MGERDKAGHLAVEALVRAGARRFYTVPGESFLEVLDAAERHPEASLVSTRHESGASFMAEAEAKMTGVPAVAMATRGVGASNLAIGVHTAMQDSTPMVVMLGHVETDYLDREAFQEVDLAAFYAPITKWATTVHRADRLPSSPPAPPGSPPRDAPGPSCSPCRRTYSAKRSPTRGPGSRGGGRVRRPTPRMWTTSSAPSSGPRDPS